MRACSRSLHAVVPLYGGIRWYLNLYLRRIGRYVSTLYYILYVHIIHITEMNEASNPVSILYVIYVAL